MKVFVVCVLTLGAIDCLLYPGDECILPTEERGVCTSIHDCEPVVLKLRAGVIPKNCGFEGNTPIVCCPTEKNLSAEKCKEIIERAPRDLQRIVGGVEVLNAKEYPHMAAIGYGDLEKPEFKCGGSLVSEKFVLTAAHCVYTKFGKAQVVQFGDIELYGYIGIRYGVEKRITHPEYIFSSTYYDIALLKLNQTVHFTQEIQPACLSYPDLSSRDLKGLTATGWGLTQFAGASSDHLLKVNMEVFDLEACIKEFKVSRRLANGIQEDSQLCAGGKGVVGDTCQGDSGGPLQKQLPLPLLHVHLIVGVTSFGKTCGVANIPGVYTKVSYYLPWIESVIWA